MDTKSDTAEFRTTALVVPLKREALGFIETLKDVKRERVKNRTVYSGRIGDGKCALIISGCGKIRAATATQILLDTFPDIQRVIHFGSAGALSSEVTPGDIVIGQEIVEHDYHQLFDGKQNHPLVESDSELLHAFTEFSKSAAAASGLRIIGGRILSGNEDIVTAPRRNELLKRHGGLCVDWESAACAQTCRDSDVPCLVLRGITDSANENTYGEFDANLAEVSRKLGRLISEFIKRTHLPTDVDTRVVK